MKMLSFLFLFFIVQAVQTVQAEERKALVPCFDASQAKYFEWQVEYATQAGDIPLFIYNKDKQVVGFVALTLGEPATLERVVLCSQLEVDDFFYSSEGSADPKNWVKKKAMTFDVTQDEGMILMKAKFFKEEEGAIVSQVTFKAYDVMTDSEEWTAADKKSPDFVEDWGLPKGKGEFYLSIPKYLLK